MREGRPVLTERRSYEFSSGIATSEVPHDVIQSTSQIVDTVTNKGAQQRVEFGDFRAVWKDIVILVNDNSARVRLNIQRHSGLESLKVLFCPDDFEPCSI